MRQLKTLMDIKLNYLILISIIAELNHYSMLNVKTINLNSETYKLRFIYHIDIA